MENYPKPQDHRENPPPQTPNAAAAAAAAAASSSPTARAGSRASDPVPYPTTFVQAEPSTFKQVVQMLTGSSDTAAAAAASSPKHHPGAGAGAGAKGAAPGPKKPAFKLYERRSSTLKSLKVLSPLMPAFVFPNPCSSSSPIGAGGAAPAFSPRGAAAAAAAEVLSPSLLDLPSLVLSPVTPLLPDPFARPAPPPAPGTEAAEAAEERAIAEKGFYLHPSPRSSGPPRLLPLFPVTSPRRAPAPASASASASASAPA